jgi:DNA-binding response OmpR family regulator
VYNWRNRFDLGGVESMMERTRVTAEVVVASLNPGLEASEVELTQAEAAILGVLIGLAAEGEEFIQPEQIGAATMPMVGGGGKNGLELVPSAIKMHMSTINGKAECLGYDIESKKGSGYRLVEREYPALGRRAGRYKRLRQIGFSAIEGRWLVDKLTRQEFRLTVALGEGRGSLAELGQALECDIDGLASDWKDLVRAHMGNLRPKLADAGYRVDLVWSRGYRLEDEHTGRTMGVGERQNSRG